MALLNVRFMSDALKMEMGMNVIVPLESQYPKPQGRKEYPVLYLLHGMGQDETSWCRYTRIEQYLKGRELVVVMPAGHRGFYTNTVSGHKYFDFMTEELPAICRNLLPISAHREDTFVAGLSMGGYGAYKLAIHRPDLYSAAASLSGVVALPEKNPMNSPEKQKELSYYFGEKLFDTEHDLLFTLQKKLDAGVDLPKFYMACGTEDGLYWTNRLFMERFGDKVDIVFEDGPGAHTWEFWDEYILKVLDWLPLRGTA